MKRKAILIGNTRGLNGVQLDIEKTHAFLMSKNGGAWTQSEIEVFENPRRAPLIARIEALKKESIDYAFVLFSGHGGHERTTILELNERGETIPETQLFNIAPRQVTIHDCCRVISQKTEERAFAMDSITESSAYPYTRARFERRIMEAIPQQVRLYACAVDECSIDTPKGAVYLGSLLEAAAADLGGEYTTVGTAHEIARLRTSANGSKQSPEAYLPKCLTNQQLIISLR